MPPVGQVDLPHIERAVDQLLKKDGGLQLYQGDILASYYLDSLAEDVHQALQAAGRVTIGDLAMQYNFSSEFMAHAACSKCAHPPLQRPTRWLEATYAVDPRRVDAEERLRQRSGACPKPPTPLLHLRVTLPLGSRFPWSWVPRPSSSSLGWAH